MPVKQSIKLERCPLPQEAVAISRKEAARLLQISQTQLRREQSTLSLLQPKGWNYTANAKGFLRSAFEVLWLFRQLVKQCGRTTAIQAINQVMEQQQ